MVDQAAMQGCTLEEYLHIVRSGPAQYFNRRGVLDEAGGLTRRFGSRALLNGGKRALAAVEEPLCRSLRGARIEYAVNRFAGESSEANVQTLIEAAKKFGAHFIIGAGGGKALDTAKIAADCLRVPIVTVPTIAATCAASTPLGIFYTDEGVYSRDYYPLTNPQMVLVDPDVQLHAPIEFLKSGILDSLSKWYEGGASFAMATEIDMFDSMAITLAEYLNTNMLEKAGAAIRAAERGELSPELVDVVNMNIFLAGTIQAFGVKAVRNGIAHSVHNGLTVLKESHGLLHGIKVGYGIAVQLVMLEPQGERLERLARFYTEIGFSPSFHGLSLDFNERNIDAVASKTVADPLMKRKPFDAVSHEMVADAARVLESRYGEARPA